MKTLNQSDVLQQCCLLTLIYLSVRIFSLFTSPSFALSIVPSPAPSQVTPPVIWSIHTHTTTTAHVYVYLLASEFPAN